LFLGDPGGKAREGKETLKLPLNLEGRSGLWIITCQAFEGRCELPQTALAAGIEAGATEMNCRNNSRAAPTVLEELPVIFHVFYLQNSWGVGGERGFDAFQKNYTS
jgi:hypothetical protein